MRKRSGSNKSGSSDAPRKAPSRNGNQLHAMMKPKSFQNTVVV
ncbi:hypothetical protein [Lysinibacillus xylanilyticus]